MAKPPLEERAKELLKWKITKKGEMANPFRQNLIPEINYLVKNGYVTRSGETPKSLSYNVTPEGRKWAIGE
ncbi:MAG: hypothetical protein ABIH65_01860 [Nanoarchaeota archaeon]